jgi:hypothetical protein
MSLTKIVSGGRIAEAGDMTGHRRGRVFEVDELTDKTAV